MRRVRLSSDVKRALSMVNYCNTQVANINEQAIIRVLLAHASAGTEAGPIGSLEDVAKEAHISQASVSRFVRKVGYESYSDFRDNFVREFDELSLQRKEQHERFLRDSSARSVKKAVWASQQDNIRATMEHTDWVALSGAVSEMARARSVLILGDDHVLSDLYTLQLNLLACGVPAYLYKNEEAQLVHVGELQRGDMVLFVTVAAEFVTFLQEQMLLEAHAKEGVRVVGLSQDAGTLLPDAFDELILFGVPGSLNHGFASLWLLSEVMSEMLYEL